METNINKPTVQLFKKLSLYFSVAVSVMGAVVLIGWIADSSILKSISPGWVSMKANTAICFLLAGFTMIMLNRAKVNATSKILALALATFILLTATVTLLQYMGISKNPL